jgi:hypothetical protein
MAGARLRELVAMQADLTDAVTVVPILVSQDGISGDASVSTGPRA